MAAEGTDPLFVNVRTNTPIPIDASVIGSVVAEIIANGLTCNVQTFTASDTYTPSAGLLYAKIKVQAAGGGSGGADGVGAGSGVSSAGGGSGEYREGIFTAAQIGVNQIITIGAAGAAGSNTGGDGGNASASSVGSLISANGGSGGAGTGNNKITSEPEAGGAGGTGGSGGYLAIPGQQGGWSYSVNDNATFTNVLGGFGGNAHLGLGAIPNGGLGFSGDTLPIAAVAGGNYGGGASGAAIDNVTGIAGAVGGPAIVIIEEYIFTS